MATLSVTGLLLGEGLALIHDRAKRKEMHSEPRAERSVGKD